MPASNEIISRLRRTMQSIFRIGSINFKDNSGVAEFRNAGDTAYVDSAANKVRVHGSNASNSVILTAPGSLGSSVTFTLPPADGSTGQVLSTNGSGELDFIDVASNATLTQFESFTEATSSPLSIFTPPDNATLIEVAIDLTTAAGSSGASVSVGTSGDPDAYLQTDEIDMQTVGLYRVFPNAEVGASPGAVQLTITPGAQTFIGQVYVTYVTPS